MENLSGVMMSGLLLSIVVFGAKSGVGCGLSRLSGRTIAVMAGIYLVVAVAGSLLAEAVFSNASTAVLSIGVMTHALIGAALIVGGMHTTKSFVGHRRDVTDRTFLILSAPCPACLGATFFVCYLLESIGGMGALKVGALVGITFAISIGITSYAARRLRNITVRAPTLLGNIMIFLGMFYLLSIIVIPAYLQTRTLSIVSAASSAAVLPPDQMLISAIMLVGLTALGFGVSSWAKRWS